MTLPPISRTEPVLGLDRSTDMLPGDAVARFASALDAVASRSDARGAGDVRPGASLNPETLMAADDAWVNIIAISEKLQDGDVSATEARALESLLVRNWDAFRERLDTLAAALPERGEN